MQQTPLPTDSEHLSTGHWPLLCGAGLVAVLLYLTSLYSYPLFHTLVELATLVVIWSACSIAITSRLMANNGYLLVLSAGCLAYALITLLHTLAYKGLGIFSSDANLPTQLWIAGRYLLSVTFLLAAFFLDRRVRVAPLLLGFGLATVLLVASIWPFGIFPDSFIEGRGLTGFKKGSEVVIAVLFLLALADLVRRRRHLDPTVVRLIGGMLGCAVLAELFFVFYIDVYGLSNLLGHLSNLAGFALFHQAVVKTAVNDPYRLIFRELAQNNQVLEARVAERTAQLQETALFLRESQGIARVGGWKHNPESGVWFWTDELYRLLEYPADSSLAADALWSRIDQAESGQVRHAAQTAWRHDTPFCIECRLTTMHGSALWVELRCNGRVPGVGGGFLVGTVQDITPRKQVEQALVAAREAAEAAARAKDEFLSTISHELRTPLNGVLGSLQLLELGRLDDEQRLTLGMAMESAERELELVNDLLELTAIEAGALVPRLVPFRLHDTMSAVVQGCAAACSAQGLTLSVEVSELVPQVVLGDAGQLRRMLTILLNNAVKFTPQGGITVSASLLEQHGLKARIVIAVEDTGVGIRPEMLERIFEPFVQVDMSSTRRFGGTGLGLALCRRLAELVGGTVSARMRLEGGSRFELELPFALQQPLGLDGVAAARHAVRRILVVEDDATSQRLVVRLLRQLGHLVDAASNGAEALELLSKGRYELVLMDVLMPEMDGLETLRRLREAERQRGVARTPVIVLTADVLRCTEEGMLSVGFDAYLTKPLQLDQLQACLVALPELPDK